MKTLFDLLVEEGVRDQMTLIASGGLRTAWDIAKAIALGADGVVVGTAELVALECIRCGNCESGRGCPRGIATTDSTLCNLFEADWGAQRIANLFNSWTLQLREILWRFGMNSVRDLVGRSDLLAHGDFVRPEIRRERSGTGSKPGGTPGSRRPTTQQRTVLSDARDAGSEAAVH